jgi:hypothetical protein
VVHDAGALLKVAQAGQQRTNGGLGVGGVHLSDLIIAAGGKKDKGPQGQTSSKVWPLSWERLKLHGGKGNKCRPLASAAPCPPGCACVCAACTAAHAHA